MQDLNILNPRINRKCFTLAYVVFQGFDYVKNAIAWMLECFLPIIDINPGY